MNSPRVLVTGASGFVGRAVCSALISSGYSIVVAGRTKSTLAQLQQIGGKDIPAVEVGDISALTDWTQALEEVDAVIHLAARVHMMKDCATNPLAEFHKVNVEGTARLAHQASRLGVRRFIFISTVKVNGESTTNKPFDEQDPPHPVDPYAFSKYEAEELLRQLATVTGMEVVILRPPLVYGEGVGANFLRLLKLVERGIPLPLASVNNRRSLLYLGNLVDAITTCLIDPRAAGETFFVSDGCDISTPELIRRIALFSGCKTSLWPFPVSVLRSVAKLAGSSVGTRLLDSLTVDCRKIREKLDWQPPYSLDDGIGNTVRWHRESRLSVR